MTAMMIELTRNPMKSIHAIRAKVKKKYGFADHSDRRLSGRFDQSIMGQSGFLSSPSKRMGTMRSTSESSHDSGALYHEERWGTDCGGGGGLLCVLGLGAVSLNVMAVSLWQQLRDGAVGKCNDEDWRAPTSRFW